MRYVFFCEDHLDGIFSGVYDAWAAKVGHGNVELRTRQEENYELFCVWNQVETDLTKSYKVLRTIRKQLGAEITECICYAACSSDEQKGTAIYQTLVDCLSVYGTSYGKKRLENLKHPSVRKVMELHRTVWNEVHHYLGFVRFRQISPQVLFATISPKHDILLLLQEHFSDRFAGEFWIVYDDKRKKALLHVPRRGCSIYAGDETLLERLSSCEDIEGDFESLFRGFCDSISIKERENPSLQRQNLPYRFRDHMTEFL